MSSKKLIKTPLHLLYDLTGSLVSYFEEACIQVQQDAEKALTKLEKQRAKVQQKLITTQAKLEKAKERGKPKAKNKAKNSLSELETIYLQIQKQQAKILDYIALLKKDTTTSLELLKDITHVHERTKLILETPATKVKAVKETKTTASIPNTSTNTAAKSKQKTATKPKVSTAKQTAVKTNTTASQKKPTTTKAPAKITATKNTPKPTVTKAKKPNTKITK